MDWKFPDKGWIKYNINRVSSVNLGINSWAYCLRDEKGDLLQAEGAKMEDTTNSEAEAQAILKEIIHCSQANLNKIIIQIDSMVMLKVLTNEWQCPWNLLDIKEEIITLWQTKEVKFMHIIREGNQLADYCANLEINGENFKCTSFQKLDSKARRILNSDKLHYPYI